MPKLALDDMCRRCILTELGQAWEKFDTVPIPPEACFAGVEVQEEAHPRKVEALQPRADKDVVSHQRHVTQGLCLTMECPGSV